MKALTTLLLITSSLVIFGQSTYKEWEIQAETNIRLRPKYGNVEKTKEQKEIDQKFVEETMEIKKFNGSKRLASNHMIELGFQYLYKRDLKTAMYRFNQAYLLDNENTDIYWGFGAIYMSLSNLEKAKGQYEEGLKLNPENTHLLTDYGTYFLTKYNQYPKNDNAHELLNFAIDKYQKSYSIDSKNQDTLFKLSMSYLMNNDCKNAKKFYKLCKVEDDLPINRDYAKELNMKCK